MQIAKLPRVRLANLPTPLQEMPRLTKKLGGPRLLVKRDDLTGLAMGGNKTRKLEFIIADAESKGADVIVTGAGLQSNWSTQAAAAAIRCGMKPVIVSYGPLDEYRPEEYGGNQILHYVLGADVRVCSVSSFADLQKEFDGIAEEYRERGYNPYIIRFGGSNSLGIMGYANAMLELLSQATDQGVEIDYIVVCCGAGGTHAGLLLGAKALNTGIKVIGISNSPPNKVKLVTPLVNKGAQLLDIDLTLKPEDVTVFTEYVGKGYGIIYKEVADAIKLVAETEGIFLDPVYTGKAMTGLIDLVKKGYFAKKDTVVFLHTGGTPALFAYKAPIKCLLESKTPQWTKPPWGAPGLSELFEKSVMANEKKLV